MTTRIAVVGTGYVGLSIAVLLAQRHSVVGLDIDAARVAGLQSGHSPINDPDIEHFLDEAPALGDAGPPTPPRRTTAPSWCSSRHPPTTTPSRTTSTPARSSPSSPMSRGTTRTAVVVIKSTVPVGFTAELAERTGANVIFSPEFLREGKALHDNLHPARIVVGDRGDRGRLAARAAARGGARPRRPGAAHREHRGRGDQAVRQHLPGDARGVLQRARHLHGDARPRPPAGHRGRRASTRASGTTTTTRPSGTAATACPRTPSSCWPTTATCRRA